MEIYTDIHTIIVYNFFNILKNGLLLLQKKIKKSICGDFNFDLLKVDVDQFTQHFFNLLCSYGFLPHILQPTRVTANTATVVMCYCLYPIIFLKYFLSKENK